MSKSLKLSLMLVNCVAYQQGKKISDITIGEISDYVERPDCFVWVALKDPDLNEIKQMQEEFHLHPLAIEDAQQGHQSPKIEEYGNSLFVVLHTIELDDQKQFKIGELHIFVSSNYVLTIRHNSKQGFSNVRDRCEREPELLKFGSGFVLYALIDTVVDRYFPVESYLNLEFEATEQRVFERKSDIRENIEEIYSLKQQLMTLHHAVSPLLPAVARLQGGRVPSICQGMQDYFRDVFDHLTRISRSIEKLREMSATAMQVTVSLIALNESEVSKKLASYGALFAVPTAIAGIYGMNFRYMPELEWKYGYPLVVFSIVIFDLILFRYFRRSGWL